MFCSSAVLGCGLLLSVGCAVGLDFVVPVPPVAEAWHEATDEVITEEPADYGAWWEGFDDPVLNKLIDAAYDENLILQVAAIRVLEARARHRNQYFRRRIPQSRGRFSGPRPYAPDPSHDTHHHRWPLAPITLWRCTLGANDQRYDLRPLGVDGSDPLSDSLDVRAFVKRLGMKAASA